MASDMFPQRRAVAHEETVAHLRRARKVAQAAMTAGRHPFGAVLVDGSGVVRLEQGNIDTVNHAEATMCRKAHEIMTPAELWQSTLYTTFEPCCMCAGTAYWANIGRVVYAVTEAELGKLTGPHPENMTLNLPCRDVFASGMKDVQVEGPLADLRDEMIQDHVNFWSLDKAL